MTTILIWLGSGFAFAAGFMVGIWLMTWKKGNQDAQNDLTADSLVELRRRNEIGLRQAEALERVAIAVESIRG